MRSGASKTKAPQRSAGGMRNGAKGSMTGVKHPKRAEKRQNLISALGGGTANRTAQPQVPQVGAGRMLSNPMAPARPAPGVRRLGGGQDRGGRGAW